MISFKEVSLDVLDTQKCNQQKHSIDPDRELCIGKVLQKPVVGTFEKEGDGHYRMTDMTSRGFYDFVGFRVRNLVVF